MKSALDRIGTHHERVKSVCPEFVEGLGTTSPNTLSSMRAIVVLLMNAVNRGIELTKRGGGVGGVGAAS